MSNAKAVFGELQQDLLRKVGDEGWPIGFSIGVAVFNEGNVAVDKALHIADELMYRVKKGGKNSVLFEECSSSQ